MKLRKTISLVLVVLMLALVVGCKKSPQELPAQSIKKSGDITDPMELEKLWQEYFYDSIATVGNTREFNSAQEIEPLNVARFCGLKYVAEQGEENLTQTANGSPFRLLPLDIVLEYAKRYFDLTSLDVSKVEAGSYDQQKQAFIFDFNTRGTRPSYNAARGDQLDKVTRNSDGTVTAVLVRPDHANTDRIELTKTYTLKQREDGSLFFVNGRWDYVNNHLVSLVGDYQRFDQISGFIGNMAELSMLGEADDSLILAYTPYSIGENAALMLVNPKTMTVEKKLEVSENFASTDVSLTGEYLKIRLKDRVIAVDKTFAQEDSVSLPKTIAEKVIREPKYNSKGNPDVFFGGYDVSSDKKRYVYADEIGVKLLNTTDNSEILLSKTVPITGSELLENSYHQDPRFVADEQKVITTMTGYEGNDNANNKFYLNRLNLKTFQIEPKIISVKAAEAHVLGVLTDGGIVFWYSLNPSENGVCITK